MANDRPPRVFQGVLSEGGTKSVWLTYADHYRAGFVDEPGKPC